MLGILTHSKYLAPTPWHLVAATLGGTTDWTGTYINTNRLAQSQKNPDIKNTA